MTHFKYRQRTKALNIAFGRVKLEAAASAAGKRKFSRQAPTNGFCGPAQRDADGVGKSIVTDYRFVGPAAGTHKHVGWGEPQTPSASSMGGAA